MLFLFLNANFYLEKLWQELSSDFLYSPPYTHTHTDFVKLLKPLYTCKCGTVSIEKVYTHKISLVKVNQFFTLQELTKVNDMVLSQTNNLWSVTI